ncbi:MAG: CoA transferase [Candidatus Dormiibacterota bacterium]
MSGIQGRGVLGGLRIIELSAFVAAPLGGATLAELGAEVVRVDPPGGGMDAKRWPLHNGESLYWAGLNNGKKSVTIDTATPEGQRLVTELIAKAGIVLTNLPSREWNSYATLQLHRPDLIMAILTGSPDGSPAVDYTVNAAVGFPFVTGPEEMEAPINHVLPAWDALAGYMLATGIVTAELYRTRTGSGQCITLSLMDVALSITSHLGIVAEAQLDDSPRPRLGNYLYGSYSCDFKTRDGRYVIAVALTASQWARLIAATGSQEQVQELEVRYGVDLREEGARFQYREEISELLRRWIGSRSYQEVSEAFDRRQVLWGPYQTFKELVAHDSRCSEANPMIKEIYQPGLARYLRAASPLQFSETEREPPHPAPLMGEDTREVLESWLGLAGDQVDALIAAGVVAA